MPKLQKIIQITLQKSEKPINKLKFLCKFFTFCHFGCQNGLLWLTYFRISRFTSLPFGIVSMLLRTELLYSLVLCVERVSRLRNHRTWKCCRVRSWCIRLFRRCRSRPCGSCLSASVKDEEVSFWCTDSAHVLHGRWCDEVVCVYSYSHQSGHRRNAQHRSRDSHDMAPRLALC